MSATTDTLLAAVRTTFESIELADRPEVWITLRPQAEVEDEAAGLAKRVAAGENLPLAGLMGGVKDNIDVAGLPTTAAAPSYAYRPTADAPAVARLRAAGALFVGKTNLRRIRHRPGRHPLAIRRCTQRLGPGADLRWLFVGLGGGGRYGSG